MRVLQIHNRYRSSMPSGENTVVDQEAELLTAAGVEVLRHVRTSDEIDGFGLVGKLGVPLRPLRSREDCAAVAEILQRDRPDVVHLHNPNPLISMSVVRVARDHGVPVVMTVHNHRHTCVKGTFRRDGHACHDCSGKRVPYPGVLHGCYRDSRLQSVPAVASLAAHRSTYQLVDRYLAISSAMRDSIVRGGVPAERVTVKPNSVPDPGAPTPVRADGRLTFVGRLDEDKGVLLLLEAWCAGAARPGHELTLIGSGPLLDRAQQVAAQRPDVRVTGQLPAAEVDRRVRESTALLMPSLWEEPFGLVAVEALARARPVMTTGAGGLGDIVDASCGWVVEPTVGAWRQALDGVTREAAARLGQVGRRRYEERWTPDQVTDRLIAAYRSVLTPAGRP